MVSIQSSLSAEQLVLSMLVLGTSVANACTDFVLGSEDKSIVVGRTADIFGRSDSDFITHPVGEIMTSTLAGGTDGMEWEVRNPFLGISFLGLPVSAEGLNTKGLACSLLMLGDSEYQTLPDEDDASAQAINQLNFCDWALATFDDVAQVNETLYSGDVTVTAITIADLRNLLPGVSRLRLVSDDAGISSDFPIGYHYSLHDKSGASLVVEYTAGGLKTYDNKVGVLTNDPDFVYQQKSLSEFLALRNPDPVPAFNSVKPRQNPVKITAEGMDVNMVGLPGDYSANSRFLRTAVNLNTLVFPTVVAEAVNAAKYMISSIEMFAGVVYQAPANAGDVPDQPWVTAWATVRDVTNGVYQFHSYSNLGWKQINLNDLDFTEGAPSMSVTVDLPDQTYNAVQEMSK